MAQEKEIDALYALPLERFVSERDLLARRLRKEGDREGAEEVRGLPKPTVSAWAVNQLARRERLAVRALLSAGERLRSAFASGSGATLRAAGEAQRKAIETLVAAARGILSEAGQTVSDATLDRIALTLRAGSADEQARLLLQRGRLSRDVESSGFDPFAGLALTSPPPGKPGGAPSKRRAERVAPPQPSSPDEHPVRRAEETIARLKADTRALRESVEDGEAEAARARRQAEAAERRAAREREKLERLLDKLSRAEADLSALRAGAGEA